MWCNKRAAVLALGILTGQASAASLSCPRYHDGVRLSTFAVFDGRPEHLTDLIGEGDGWDISGPSSYKGESYHLVCTYARNAKVDLPIPASIKRCVPSGSVTSPAIKCQ